MPAFCLYSPCLMGIWIPRKKVVAQQVKGELALDAKLVEPKKPNSPSNDEYLTRPVEDNKGKTIRFKLHEDEEEVISSNNRERYGKRKDGVVRIRVVLTRSELKQLLNQDVKCSSVEQLLGAIELRSNKKISQARQNQGGLNGNWRPALDSIPEDY